MKKIDWKAQWELHAPNFKKGCAHINLLDFGGPNQIFRLKPGPGFGDLSHPTTRLVLELMPKKISCPVIDIGCGSGILSIAAGFLGAPVTFGIDCDEKALAHAKENKALNGLKNLYFSKTLPPINPPVLILMNMISSEQRSAWKAVSSLHSVQKNLIISGILAEEAQKFLEEKVPNSYGQLKKLKSLDGWSGLFFS